MAVINPTQTDYSSAASMTAPKPKAATKPKTLGTGTRDDPHRLAPPVSDRGPAAKRLAKRQKKLGKPKPSLGKPKPSLYAQADPDDQADMLAKAIGAIGGVGGDDEDGGTSDPIAQIGAAFQQRREMREAEEERAEFADLLARYKALKSMDDDTEGVA